jgi:hypothetical protein
MAKGRNKRSVVRSSSRRGPEHFVYIYRDERSKARYVGYGRSTARAVSHTAGSHNAGLNTFLAKQQFLVQIAGPYESEAAGRAVETALISALEPDLNIDPGQSRWRFRPLGIPVKYADRGTQGDLLLQDFIALQGARPVPALFVIVTDKYLDGRIGYNIAAPPTDAQIRQRVEKWWKLGKYLGTWAASPDDSPGLLLGIHGAQERSL